MARQRVRNPADGTSRRFPDAPFTVPAVMDKFRAYPTTQELAQIFNHNLQTTHSVDGANRFAANKMSFPNPNLLSILA